MLPSIRVPVTWPLCKLAAMLPTMNCTFMWNGRSLWKTLDTSEFWTCLKVRLNLSQKQRKVKIGNALFRGKEAVMECMLAFCFGFSFSSQNLRNKRVCWVFLWCLLSALHKYPLHSHTRFKQIHQVFLLIQGMCAYSWMERWVNKRRGRRMRNALERDELKKNEGEENAEYFSAFLSSQYTDMYFHLSLCIQSFLQKWDGFIFSVYLF